MVDNDSDTEQANADDAGDQFMQSCGRSSVRVGVGMCDVVIRSDIVVRYRPLRNVNDDVVEVDADQAFGDQTNTYLTAKRNRDMKCTNIPGYAIEERRQEPGGTSEATTGNGPTRRTWAGARR